jgi:hypothetical protein
MDKADHSPPFSAEVKNTCTYRSIPPYALMAWCLIEGKGKSKVVPVLLLTEHAMKAYWESRSIAPLLL